MKQSTGFHPLVGKSLPLSPTILVLILMKNGPNRPLMKPIIIAPGIIEDGVVRSAFAVPNFKEPSDQSIGLPCNRASRIPSVNVAVEVVIKTFHNKAKFQNGFSNDSS